MTDYDLAHATTYLRLLDAEQDGAPWEEVARIVLGLDPARDRQTARRAHQTHLARAHWMSSEGYRELVSKKQ